jgi:hypothetical protein
MTKRIAVLASVVALAGLAVIAMARQGDTQTGGQIDLTIGIYTPTVAFANSAARLAYVQRLAKAVGTATGARVQGKSYTSLGALKKASPDFGIVASQCYAGASGWKLLANAEIDGKTSRGWALYSSEGPKMDALQGKKLAYVKTGCGDDGFTFFALLEDEVGKGFFSGRVGKPDIAGAVAEVASYKGAQAVFAPVGMEKGLTKVFDAGAVPNPAFVQVNGKLDGDLVARVAKAITEYGGGGAIAGWQAASEDPYRQLGARMKRRDKRPSFAAPDPVRVDASDALIEPTTLDQPAFTEVKQHFDIPPDRQ